MSLTTLLKLFFIKDMFDSAFSFQSPALKGALKAPPKTKNYSTVGTAFDYLLRFYLERINRNVIKRRWVADFDYDSTLVFGGSIIPDMLDDNPDLMESLLNQTKNAYGNYIKSGKMNDDIMEASIKLAQLETFRRSGKILPDLGSVNRKDVDDLRNLISLVKPAIFKAKKILVLNPTFGKGSKLVLGADADLLVDDTLIDIKTTKHLRLTRDYYYQLIGYYALYRIGGIDGVKNPKIKNIGIYFSRYGILHKIPVSSIATEQELEKFIMEFKKETGKLRRIIKNASR